MSGPFNDETALGKYEPGGKYELTAKGREALQRLVPDRVVEMLPPDPYLGIAREPFTIEACAILEAPIPENEIAIRPDNGQLYLPQVHYRKRLNKAFGLGGWGIRPKMAAQVDGKKVMYTAMLYVHGRFVAEAMGVGTWVENNPTSNFGTALESAKSDALTRCCKDIGIALEMWDPPVANRWRAENCVKVHNPDYDRFGRAVKVWLRMDDPALDKPKEAVPPNVPTYSRNKETGQPIMGSWPKLIPDPSADGQREIDDQYRRTMGTATDSDLAVVLQRSIDANTIEVTDARTGVITREVKAMQTQIARIHILCRELSVEEDVYRAGLIKYYGVDSSDVLTKAQASEAILRLERMKARVPADMLAAPPENEPEPVDHEDP